MSAAIHFSSDGLTWSNGTLTFSAHHTLPSSDPHTVTAYAQRPDGVYVAGPTIAVTSSGSVVLAVPGVPDGSRPGRLVLASGAAVVAQWDVEGSGDHSNVSSEVVFNPFSVPGRLIGRVVIGVGPPPVPRGIRGGAASGFAEFAPV